MSSSVPSADSRAELAGESRARSPVVGTVLAHALIWTVLPALFLGNLYPDTITAAYWGRDFAFGYFQHPPMTSWIIDAALWTGHFQIFLVLLTAQITVAAAAIFVWKTARLYGSAETAALAVLLYLVSPAATVFAVILNHNSMLAPFWAATMFFALRYMEGGRWRDALILGCVVGLGIMTKYEIAFLVISILGLAVAVPRFRHVFSRPASYVAAALALLIIAPNLLWLSQHHWVALDHAAGVHKVDSLAMLGTDALKILTGMMVLFLIPALYLLWTFRKARTPAAAGRPSHTLVAVVLAFAPFGLMLLGTLPTHQIVKPLWVLPMTSSMAVGAALLFARRAGERAWTRWPTLKIALRLSGGLALAFAGFLLVGEAIGLPADYFAAETRPLGAAIDDMWHSRQNGPLACVAITEDHFGGSAVIWSVDRPRFVNFFEPSWSKPEQVDACRRSGGIAVIAGTDFLQAFPNACTSTRQTVEVKTRLGLRGAAWPVELVYIAPEGETCEAE